MAPPPEEPARDTPPPTRREQAKGWMQLVRLPMLLTAPGDSLAGAALACLTFQLVHTCGGVGLSLLWPLATISVLFYAGGLIHNDVVDVKRDAAERSDRPIPSGRVKKDHAVIAMFICMAGAMFLAWHLLPFLAFRVAGGLLLCIILYNALKERSALLGATLMGLCRAGNLILGIVALSAQHDELKACILLDPTDAAAQVSPIMPFQIPLVQGIVLFYFLYVAAVSLVARHETSEAFTANKTLSQRLFCLLPLGPVLGLTALFAIPLCDGGDTIVSEGVPQFAWIPLGLLVAATLWATILFLRAKSPKQLIPGVTLLLRNLLLIQTSIIFLGGFGDAFLYCFAGAYVLHWILCRKFYAS